jgi:hypothetical protein
MATKKRKKGKRRIRKWLGRWAWRKIHTWAASVRAGAKKVTEARVIVASAKQRLWERQFPNPNKPELHMEKLEEWTEEYEAVFGNGWRVDFEVDALDTATTTREAAYDAAVLRHGEIARSLHLVEVRPLNPLAEQAMRKGAP